MKGLPYYKEGDSLNKLDNMMCSFYI
jgi:hypothetical protein